MWYLFCTGEHAIPGTKLWNFLLILKIQVYSSVNYFGLVR